jgi:hypothetical protein
MTIEHIILVGLVAATIIVGSEPFVRRLSEAEEE